ncbi:hypothetical protein R1flu_026855 [Riccia fluitans]|uniref:Uncharacterized protein n=1 Tax=Riccia fluitans TaxID=41844 RepID=A0ABD1XH64_9MARC
MELFCDAAIRRRALLRLQTHEGRAIQIRSERHKRTGEEESGHSREPLGRVKLTSKVKEIKLEEAVFRSSVKASPNSWLQKNITYTHASLKNLQ